MIRRPWTSGSSSSTFFSSAASFSSSSRKSPNDDPNGSVALGETGRGWVVLVQSFMFGLVGGALAGAAGYLIVLLMGGAARSVVRYVVGGVVGGFLGAVGVFAVFSNTVLYGSGLHLFWMLPVAGLVGGLWAGVVSSRR